MNTNTNFAERFNTALINKGVSAYALSKQIGLSQSILSDYKKGKQEPKYATIKLIASILEVNENWLINGNGEMEDKRICERTKGATSNSENKVKTTPEALNQENESLKKSLEEKDNIISLYKEKMAFYELKERMETLETKMVKFEEFYELMKLKLSLDLKIEETDAQIKKERKAKRNRGKNEESESVS